MSGLGVAVVCLVTVAAMSALAAYVKGELTIIEAQLRHVRAELKAIKATRRS